MGERSQGNKRGKQECGSEIRRKTMDNDAGKGGQGRDDRDAHQI